MSYRLKRGTGWESIGPELIQKRGGQGGRA